MSKRSVLLRVGPKGAGKSTIAREIAADLRALAEVVVVRVEASERTCLARVRSRDAGAHLPSDDDTIARARRGSIASAVGAQATFLNERDEAPATRAPRIEALLVSLGL